MARGLADGYDQELALRESLSYPITEGAKARKMLSLEKLKQLHIANPGSVVVISDVHAQILVLHNVLRELDLIDENDQRQHPDTKLIQIGDLIDGRDLLDEQTLHRSKDWFDIIIAGNHEAAFLDGPEFMRKQFQPSLTHGLRSLHAQEKLLAAYNAHGVMLTHAGLHPDLWYTEWAPEKLADAINQEWHKFMRSSDQPHAGFFQMDNHRSAIRADNPYEILKIDNDASVEEAQISYQLLMQKAEQIENDPHKEKIMKALDWAHGILTTPKEKKAYEDHINRAGGAMWMDWAKLLEDHDPRLRQIVGHTPRGRLEESLDETIVNIDMAGARLGVAVVLPDGSIHTGSDHP